MGLWFDPSNCLDSLPKSFVLSVFQENSNHDHESPWLSALKPTESDSMALFTEETNSPYLGPERTRVEVLVLYMVHLGLICGTTYSSLSPNVKDP